MEVVIDPSEASYTLDLDVTIKREMKEEDEDYDDFIDRTPDLHLDFVQEVKTEVALTLNSTNAVLNPKTGLMVCVLCLQELRSDVVMEHMVNAHNYRRILFMCHTCQETFVERKQLNLHRKRCQPRRRKRQSLKQLLQEVDAALQKQDKHEPTTCPICSQELPKDRLKEHLTSEHSGPEQQFICDVCKRSFKLKMTLKEHIKLVHLAVEGSAECDRCGLRFRSHKYLGNHKRNVHPTGNQTHKCHVCSKLFKSKLCLHQHVKGVHPPPAAAARCQACRKVFKTSANLHQHMRVTHRRSSRK